MQSGAILTGLPSNAWRRAAAGLAHVRIGLALGAAQVRSQNDAGSVLERVLNGGQRRLDALVARDFHVALFVFLQRDIEIHADENSFSFQVKIANR